MRHKTIAALIAVTSLAISPAPAGAWQQTAPATPVHIVNVGDPLPRWDRLRPGTARYLRYREENGRRIAMDIWSRTVAFDSDPQGGARRLRITQSWNGATLPFDRSIDSWFEPESFRPLRHRTRTVRDGQAREAGFLFTPEAVTGDPNLAGNSQASLRVETPEPTFNFEADMELLATLPWREGYTARINFYHPGGDAPRHYDYRVTGAGSVDFGGRQVPCWIVTVDYGSQGDARFWIDRQSQTVLKVATRGPDIQGTLYKILLPAE